MKKLLGGKSRAAFESQLATGRAALTKLPGLEAQITTLASTIAGLKTQITDLEKQADAGKDVAGQLSAARTGLKQAQDGHDQAVAGAKSLRGVKADVDAGTAALKQLDAAKVKLDAGATALASAKKTLAGKEKQLDAAAAKLPAAKKSLDAAAANLRAGGTKTSIAADQLAAAQRKVDDGAAAIVFNEAKLKAGESDIAANAKKLDAAQKKLDVAEAKLPQAEADLAKGVAKLADGQQKLELGVRTAASTNGMRFVSKDGTTAAVHVTFTGSTDAISSATRTEIQQVASAPVASGVEVFYSKEIVQDLSSIFGIAEVLGLAIAAVVLLVMLGTLVAAGLPLVMAVLGVGAGVGGTLALSSVIEMASITPALALMLGLAVGIDYSLFIVHRHRRQLLEGMEMQESIGRATGTSGNAVVFAGLTVVIALSALAVPGLPFLTVLGLSAAFTVAMAVALAITLTPAVLGIIGTKLISKRAWAKAADPVHLATQTRNADGRRGWGAVVTRRPWLAAAASIVLLGIVAIPAAQLRTALPDGGAEPQNSSAYQAYDDISTAFGAGYNGPLLVLADLPTGLDHTGAQLANLDVADKLRVVPGVIAAVPVAVNKANNLGVLQVIPEAGPASVETEQLVHTLRDSTGSIKQATGSTIAVTGQVAAQIDVSEKLSEALPPYLAIVVGLSLILLLLVFRSIVVPLLATVGFLLSLAAAFGATVAVYQWGWLGSVFDVNVPGPIMSFLPILLTGILFGLAMDYQVFLVSGMREAYVHGGKAQAAVRAGFAHSAPVVTAAALIMASVFAGFVFSHLTMIRAIGFALAVGVLFDAFIVRMTLTPAIMHLLGRHAWYIPRWLDRILPDVDVEGAKLDATAPAATPGLPDDAAGPGPAAGKATVDA
ncbi:MMPL family transporter [Paeniglutamicibacter cryotolerans]